MEELSLHIGTEVTDREGITWRIFAIDNVITSIIQQDITKIKLRYIPSLELRDLILNHTMIIAPEKEPLIIDEDKLSKKMADDYNAKRAFIREIHSAYGPSYIEFNTRCKKERFENLCNGYGFHITKGYRLVRIWLQSGLDETRLLDQKHLVQAAGVGRNFKQKTGMAAGKEQGAILDEELREKFDYGIDIYSKQRLVTIKEAFMRVLYKYYTVIENDEIKLLPASQRPTERQFRYYFSIKMSKAEIEKIKTSKREFINNSRLLLGTPRDEAMRPGYILEADALEMDINIVSRFDKTQNISRPIVYMLVDIYSHAIVAFHVGFDNNSMLGLSSVMLNLFENKETLLASKGIKADISCWPSRFIPNEIRCDRGSDFASNAFSEICQDLNILRTLETPAMGSMKGMIEQSFHQFHMNVLPYFEKYGVIQKRYDSNHKREAMLTLDDIFKMLVSFVIEHNTTYMKDIKLTEAMMREGVDKTPIAIWNYGVQERGVSDMITPNNEALNFYKLLAKDEATITREGIKYKGLYYTTNTDEELKLKMSTAKTNTRKRDVKGTRLNALEIRYDPRNINHLYYLKNNKIQVLNLLPSKSGDLKDITWGEYATYRNRNTKLDKEGYENNLVNRMTRITTMNEILEHASTKHLAYSSNIRDSRRDERNFQDFNEQLHDRLIDNNHENLDIPVEPEDPKTIEIESDNEDYSLLSDDCPDELFDF